MNKLVLYALLALVISLWVIGVPFEIFFDTVYRLITSIINGSIRQSKKFYKQIIKKDTNHWAFNLVCFLLLPIGLVLIFAGVVIDCVIQSIIGCFKDLGKFIRSKTKNKTQVAGGV